MKKPTINACPGLRVFNWLIPAAVLCVAISLNFRGIQWAQLNPDERLIAKWTAVTAHQPFVTDRAYPGGFFELYRPIRAVRNGVADLSKWWARWQQPRTGDPPLAVRREERVMAVRRTNALFIAFASLFVFWAARRILLVASVTGGEMQAVFLAGLAAFIHATSPFLVEHAHYGETDGAMTLMGALVVAVLTEAMVGRRLGLIALAALIMGFAIGCKYTLVPLLIVLPVCAFVLGRLHCLGVGRSAVLAVGALFLAVIGFVIATPALYRDPAFFIREMHAASVATWGEMRGLLGRMHKTPGAGCSYKWHAFLSEVGKLGAGRWIWLLAACPFWFVPRLRRHLAVLPFFALCFLLSVVLLFPWFRNQELIPMLPFFSVTAVLPVAVLGFSRKQPRWRNVLGAVAFAAVLGFGALNLTDASRMASAFAEEESRTALKEWFRICAPDGLKMGVERYADYPQGYDRVDDVYIGKIETRPPHFLETQAIDYLVCSPGYLYRGTMNPLSGELYEDLARVRARFNARSILLKSWRLPDVQIRPIFSQIDVELRYVNFSDDDQPARNCLTTCIDQPFLINQGRFVHMAGEDGHVVGPRQVVRVSGRTTDIRFRGRHTGPWQGVAFVPQARADGVPGDAEVVWRTSGATPRKARVPHHGAQAFTIEPDSSFSLFPKERVKFRGDESGAICLLALYTDPVPAARLLRKMGNPEASLNLLTTLDGQAWNDPARIEAWLAAAALGREGEAAWRGAAEQAAGVDPIHTISGVPLDVLRDFSRLRLQGIPLGVHENTSGGGGCESLRGICPCSCLLGGTRRTSIFTCRRRTGSAHLGGIGAMWNFSLRKRRGH